MVRWLHAPASPWQGNSAANAVPRTAGLTASLASASWPDKPNLLKKRPTSCAKKANFLCKKWPNFGPPKWTLFCGLKMRSQYKYNKQAEPWPQNRAPKKHQKRDREMGQNNFMPAPPCALPVKSMPLPFRGLRVGRRRALTGPPAYRFKSVPLLPPGTGHRITLYPHCKPKLHDAICSS